jgi:hypothetical protein
LCYLRGAQRRKNLSLFCFVAALLANDNPRTTHMRQAPLRISK